MRMAQPQLPQSLERLLAGGGARPLQDAARLWRRVQQFIGMGLVSTNVDRASLHLACAALQLPGLAPRRGQATRAPLSLRQRAQQAAELLPAAAEQAVDESLLERTSHLLGQLPLRQTTLPEAQLLADAVNLDDFGMVGLLSQVGRLWQEGNGSAEILQTFSTREQYGYWAARLKDGFHFEPVRQMARQWLEHASAAVAALRQEVGDQP